MVEEKDLIIALLGAAAAIGGLVLVFLGVTITTAQGYDATTPESVTRPFRIMSGLVVVVFMLSMISVLLSVAWLLMKGNNDALYGWDVGIFIAQLVGVVSVAIAGTRILLSS